mgnify:CR=1 FL=1
MVGYDTPTKTRDLILDAAESLFASQGYPATTIKQVAAQVGVQGPALYKHFTSKRALFEEVLERLFTPFTALLTDEATTGGNQREISTMLPIITNMFQPSDSTCIATANEMQ